MTRFPHIVAGATCATLAWLPLATNAAEVPGWVLRRPAANGYAVGIGTAPVQGDDRSKAHNRAMAAALREIASQVQVVVAGETTLRLHEDRAAVTSEYETTVRSASTTALEGVEIVDTWAGSDRCWVYARLDLARFRRAQDERAELEAARVDALLLRMKAPGATAGQVLAAGVQALERMGAPQTPADHMSDRRAEILDELRRCLADLELRGSEEPTASAEPASAEPAELAVEAAFGVGGVAAGLPLRFTGSDGILVQPLAWTDGEGRATAALLRVKAPDTVTATVDPTVLLISPGDAAVTDALRRLPLPTVSWQVTVPQRRALLTGAGPDLRPALAAILAEYGVHVVSRPDTSALHIDVRVHVARTSEVGGVFFALVDLAVTVEDGDGRRLYTNTVPGVQGAGTTSAGAVTAALRNPSARLREAAITGRRVWVRAAPRRRTRQYPPTRVGSGDRAATPRQTERT